MSPDEINRASQEIDDRPYIVRPGMTAKQAAAVAKPVDNDEWIAFDDHYFGACCDCGLAHRIEIRPREGGGYEVRNIRLDEFTDAIRADRRFPLIEERDLMRTAGIIEVAVRNPSVAEYMRHWEERATKAEAALAQQPRETTAHPNAVETLCECCAERFITNLPGWCLKCQAQADKLTRFLIERPTQQTPDLQAISRICHAVSHNCVMVDDPEREPCTAENCAAVRAARTTQQTELRCICGWDADHHTIRLNNPACPLNHSLQTSDCVHNKTMFNPFTGSESCQDCGVQVRPPKAGEQHGS